MVSKAEQSTLDYIKSNNSSKEIYEYGLSINEYFEEVSGSPSLLNMIV